MNQECVHSRYSLDPFVSRFSRKTLLHFLRLNLVIYFANHQRYALLCRRRKRRGHNAKQAQQIKRATAARALHRAPSVAVQDRSRLCGSKPSVATRADYRTGAVLRPQRCLGCGKPSWRGMGQMRTLACPAQRRALLSAGYRNEQATVMQLPLKFRGRHR